MLACDHRGYENKKKLIPLLHRLGHEVKDYGCHSSASVDYPDYAAPAARAVADGSHEIAILLLPVVALPMIWSLPGVPISRGTLRSFVTSWFAPGQSPMSGEQSAAGPGASGRPRLRRSPRRSPRLISPDSDLLL